jgi:hypothetical protein
LPRRREGEGCAIRTAPMLPLRDGLFMPFYSAARSCPLIGQGFYCKPPPPVNNASPKLDLVMNLVRSVLDVLVLIADTLQINA